MKISGLVDGKYGASTQSGWHFLLKDLHAAHLVDFGMFRSTVNLFKDRVAPTYLKNSVSVSVSDICTDSCNYI